MRRTSKATVLAALTIFVAGAATAQADGGKKINVALEGEQQTAAGDPDGSGTANLRINPGQNRVCYSISVRDIDPATLAHIHEGPAGGNGPVVVDFAPPTNGTSSGCATVTRELALEIIKAPQDYYVNIHNPEFPAGALRGQLAL